MHSHIEIGEKIPPITGSELTFLLQKIDDVSAFEISHSACPMGTLYEFAIKFVKVLKVGYRKAPCFHPKTRTLISVLGELVCS